MTIRTATTADITTIFNIEQKCFADAWSLDSLAGFLNEKGRSVYVAEEAGKIIGYGVTMQVVDECEILRIAVNRLFRKKGVGTLLLERMIRNAAVDGAKLFFLEVRESNTSAKEKKKKLGFTKSGMRNNYYTNPVENAVLMSKCVTRDSLI